MPYIPDMVEGAVDAIIARMRSAFNTNLDLVRELWEVRGGPPLNLTHVAPDRYFISEADSQPLVLPAVFVVPDRSPHDLRAQQWFKQDHKILMGVLVESTLGAQPIQRLVWRYAQATVLTLHDRNLSAVTGGEATTRILVTEVVYGPTAWRLINGTTTYRKDITVRLDATQREAFEH